MAALRRGPRDPYFTQAVIGERGVGKTVYLSLLAQQMTREPSWIVVRHQARAGAESMIELPEAAGRSWLFWIALAYVVVLLVLFVVYQLSHPFRDALPSSIGPVPIGVPWFGALGAALISLQGTITYRLKWKAEFEYWHYARPWIGAIIGSIGTLILLVVIQASTTATPKLDHLALYVVAFIVGYREESFRALIKRAGDLLLAPGESVNKDGGSSKT